MSGWLIIACGLAYVGVSIDQYIKGELGIALMFAGYAIAQWGVFMQAK